MFDREALFITTKLLPLLEQVPNLKVRPSSSAVGSRIS